MARLSFVFTQPFQYTRRISGVRTECRIRRRFAGAATLMMLSDPRWQLGVRPLKLIVYCLEAAIKLGGELDDIGL